MPTRHTFLHALLATALLFAATACHHLPRPPDTRSTGEPSTAQPPTLVLLSLDGFRADYLQRGVSPNLQRLADEGVRAQWMTPSYPALTFPNHYSLVTGLRPDHHGVVHNTMRDEALGRFRVADTQAKSDGRWWGGTPIWVGAESVGLPSAVIFWPGGEAAINGVRPTRWLPWDDTIPPAARVDLALQWLDAPAPTRPRLVALYFETLDRAGHDHGPDSPEVDAAIAELDAAIGRLRAGLAARGLLEHTNLVVVSDHGMATVRNAIETEGMVDAADAALVSDGQSIGFAPLPGRAAAAESRLLGRHEHYECWRKQDLPPRWQYGTHDRVPPIVCQMDEGWDAVPRQKLQQRTPRAVTGSHGFDPASPRMRALFVARGPSIRRGAVLPPIDNVDVYPLLARLLGIDPSPNDGDAAALLPALREAAAEH
ncbi:ectonucleotide pyrophosphatase/phosphodiesterase [Montanilutibacter psychrotolerans]|uniref:Alkaline phosphatase family protein n=1 Tax=Montanilutibacter psychrotolerans TaxID=1327343 RepID=A0A3M8SPR1_9GAMM|nr:ectonucleotide pyrophosphatase/phosphodiesterase [Lysobacter psychrotolerans]RNF82665.1 alkaline phosphatase family protein [Lysobacter psychrotolerans]